jgi:hypothetical protein
VYSGYVKCAAHSQEIEVKHKLVLQVSAFPLRNGLKTLFIFVNFNLHTSSSSCPVSHPSVQNPYNSRLVL